MYETHFYFFLKIFIKIIYWHYVFLTFYPLYFLGSPTKDRCTEGSDTKTILSRGLAVVDCSWNQLDKTAFHRAK
uniref:Uncharacterized protein n=1 Tax=Meloidogyne enterolobii TaxID=390850 RepID=A0A6V7UK20_MELEN|nr:unnamed protein product [Meloidogyne enterolobii]